MCFENDRWRNLGRITIEEQLCGQDIEQETSQHLERVQA